MKEGEDAEDRMTGAALWLDSLDSSARINRTLSIFADVNILEHIKMGLSINGRSPKWMIYKGTFIYKSMM